MEIVNGFGNKEKGKLVQTLAKFYHNTLSSQILSLILIIGLCKDRNKKEIRFTVVKCCE